MSREEVARSWTADELETLCHALRAESQGGTDPMVRRLVADEALAEEIEQNVEQCRDWLARSRTQERTEDAHEPPAELRDRLWLIGWLLYEASWQVLRRVRPAAAPGPETDDAARLVRRLAEIARALPWPEFAPRALGALRAEALVASKLDTAQGYREAFLLHTKARERHEAYVEGHGSAPGRELELLGLKEMLLQLVLAETGTACRTAERVIGRWSEELEKADRQWDEDDEDYWIQLMFQQLAVGVSIGERALAVAGEIERDHGFTRAVDRYRQAQHTAFQNPGVMTARAALLLLPLSCEMEALGRRPGSGNASWDDLRDVTLATFVNAYRAIEKPVLDESGNPVPLTGDHQRSLVQLRLNAALLVPGLDLPSTLDFAACLELNPLDDKAVEALSVWLVGRGGPSRRGDANVIGSATMPAYIRSVDTFRAINGPSGGYRQWRLAWLELDRYASEDRRRQVRAALGMGAPDHDPPSGHRR